MNYYLLVSCIILAIGVFIMMIGGGIFNFRAYTNKKAWEGKTKPFLKIGAIISLIGIINFAISLWLQMK